MKAHNVQMPKEPKELDSIDIYLFTNGEESMPPRKYHIHKQQLYMWEDTRSYLAHSHYGTPFSMIDVFTLDGVEIHDPLSLKDGFTYVAVLAEEAFIPARYQEYILKASRSLEKRLEKIRGQENKLQDSVETENNTEEAKEESSSYKLNICKAEVRASGTSEKVKMFERKINETKLAPKSTWKTLGLANSKTSENRSLKENQQKRLFIRKPLLNARSVLAAQAKRPIVKKLDNYYLETNRQNINSAKDTQLGTASAPNSNKLNTITLVTSPPTHDNDENIHKCTNSNIKAPVTVAFKNNMYNEELDPSINEVDPGKQELSGIQNIESSKFATLKSTEELKQRISLDENDLRKVVKKVFEESIRSKATVVKLKDAAVGNNSLQFVVAYPNNFNDDADNTKNLSKDCEKHCAVINKGEVLNLKLSIQLQDNDGTLTVTNANAKPMIKEVKFHKASQTEKDVILNSENLLKNQNETCFCVKTVSLQTLFNPETKINEVTPSSDIIDNNIILVQRCNPPQNTNIEEIIWNPEDTLIYQKEMKSMYSANTDFVILTASCEPQKRICGSCKSRTPSKTEQQIRPTTVIRGECTTCKDLNQQEQCKKFFVSKVCEDSDDRRIEYFIRKKESESSMISDENKGKEYVVCKRIACDTCPRTVVDMSTQTSVTRTVFEIRPHRDGHYTFHLPPLCFIKSHKLL